MSYSSVDRNTCCLRGVELIRAIWLESESNNGNTIGKDFKKICKAS